MESSGSPHGAPRKSRAAIRLAAPPTSAGRSSSTSIYSPSLPKNPSVASTFVMRRPSVVGVANTSVTTPPVLAPRGLAVFLRNGCSLVRMASRHATLGATKPKLGATRIKGRTAASGNKPRAERIRSTRSSTARMRVAPPTCSETSRNGSSLAISSIPTMRRALRAAWREAADTTSHSRRVTSIARF